MVCCRVNMPGWDLLVDPKFQAGNATPAPPIAPAVRADMFNVFKVQHQALNFAHPKRLHETSLTLVCCWPAATTRSSWNHLPNSLRTILIAEKTVPISKQKCICWVVTCGKTAVGVFSVGFLDQIFQRLCTGLILLLFLSHGDLPFGWVQVKLSPVVLCSFAQAENSWERVRKSMLKSGYWKAKKYLKVHLTLRLRIFLVTQDRLHQANLVCALRRGFCWSFYWC